MGNKIDVDIDELERFAAQLQQFNLELDLIVNKVENQFRSLGDSWRDDQYSKFSTEWHSTFNSVNHYLNEAPAYVLHLKKKAEKLREARA